MNNISLTALMIPSKEVEVDYPGIDGFKVKLAFQSREELIKLRKKSTNKKWKGREMIEEVDDQLFLSLYVKSVVRGWTGLKLKNLNRLLLVDLSDKKDLEEEVPFNEENALALMKASAEFDSFVSETVSDLANFPTSSSPKLET
ncbi:MAG: hypothetical protein E4H07_06850 [Nitrosomonadales bacterium]|nr:MAG: hypothetical protein E4H07_06850 [Nitrosomonadales bacterium]